MTPHDPAGPGWQPIPDVDEDDFAAARTQLHWAAQVLAAIGYTHLETVADDSQSNLGWVDGRKLFAGRAVGSPPVGFGALDPAAGTIGFHAPDGAPQTTLEIAGRTLDDLYREMAAAIARPLDAAPVALTRPPYPMPADAIARGAVLPATDAAAREALAIWFHDANVIMRDLQAEHERATLPRLWPHHFDLGMLISLEAEGDPSRGRSIGIGLSPGDETEASPYWYVNAYPPPASVDGLTRPEFGAWVDDAFVGLKLDVDEVFDGDAEVVTRTFVHEAVSICQELLQ